MDLKLAVPEKFRKAKSGKNLSDSEIEFLNLLAGSYPYLLNLLTRSDVPYEGTSKESDFYLPTPGGHVKGLVIEIQGGIFQGSNNKNGGARAARTAHSSAKGLLNDMYKARISIGNHCGFVPSATRTSDLQELCDWLDEYYMEYKIYVAEKKRRLARYKDKIRAEVRAELMAELGISA